jgi:hypothetical protein
VHSIAAALFTNKRDLHFFREIGYEHNPYTHCPKENDLWERGKCQCDQTRSFGACLSLSLPVVVFVSLSLSRASGDLGAVNGARRCLTWTPVRNPERSSFHMRPCCDCSRDPLGLCTRTSASRYEVTPDVSPAAERLDPRRRASTSAWLGTSVFG